MTLMLTYRRVDDASLDYEPAPAAADVPLYAPTMAASAEPADSPISPPIEVPQSSLSQVEYEEETELPVSEADSLAASQYSENSSKLRL